MRVAALTVGSKPEGWRAMGFDVDDAGVLMLGSVRVELSASATAGTIESWALDGTDVPESIDGLATVSAKRGGPETEHPNCATGIDHVVVVTPSLERTSGSFAAIGVDCRRVREAGGGVRQGFFIVGDVLVEVVESAEVGEAEPARFWGLTAVVADIDRAAELLGERLGLVREAAQPGRRIATVRPDASGGLPLALITPRP